MKLHTNWHATWTPWVWYRSNNGVRYRARRRQLYIGRMLLATLCETTLRPRAPFYMLAPDQRLTVNGTSVFRVVRAFMRQLR